MRELTHLKVLGIRYRNARPAPDDERGLDALSASGAYESAGIPFDMSEPRLSEAAQSASENGKPGGDKAARTLDAEQTGALCGLIAADVASAVRAGSGVLVVGGNCSHGPGVVAGLQQACGAEARVGLVWFDAHGDFNTPRTSRSGSLGGMPVAVLAGLAYPDWRTRAGVARPLPVESLLLIGCRDLDEGEGRLLEEYGVRVTGMGDAGAVDDMGERSDVIYLHVDIDVLDAALVPGHRSAVAGGPSVAVLLAAMETVLATGKVAAIAVVSTSSAGELGHTTVESAADVIRGALRAWRSHGLPEAAGGRS